MTDAPYLALRTATGLSQRAVERALGWDDRRGRLSVIERGLVPTDLERRTLLRFYGDLMVAAARGSFPDDLKAEDEEA